MIILKLDAIDSTNDYLKELLVAEPLENFTVVSAENQTNGKGQMGTSWTSEPSKNIIMSVLLNEFIENTIDLFSINVAFSVAVLKTLNNYKIPELSIKWPNDIMSDSKKIGGILIENSIKTDGKINSIIGLGLNVNQTNFENLPKASSLTIIFNATFDKDEMLIKIIENFKKVIENWKENATKFWSDYQCLLFKKGIPTAFENKNQEQFMGIIQGVSKNGKLSVLLENDSIESFDLKEIKMLF